MSSVAEPLLPVDPPPSSKHKLLMILFGSAAVLMAGVVVVLLIFSGKPSEPESAGAPEKGPAGPSRPKAVDPKPVTNDASEEIEAQALLKVSEAFEKANPVEFEKGMALYTRVSAKYPGTAAARRAEERYLALTSAMQAALDRDFQGVQKEAQALAAAGRYVDALQAMNAYRASQHKEFLQKRAEVEAAVLENSCRSAYNTAAGQARDLARKGDYAQAVALLEALQKGAIPEIVSRCGKSIAELKVAAAAYANHQESEKSEGARKSFREEAAPKVLAALRGRTFEEALKVFDEAAKSPAYGGIRESLAEERAAIVEAAAFWEAFLKGLRGRQNQEVSILLADDKRIAGKLIKVLPDRALLDASDGPLEAPFEKVHVDLIVGWTLGKSLPTEEGGSYLKAAMFFFVEGRDDVAKLYLATARELKAPGADAAERVFREGYLRAAQHARAFTPK